MVIFPCVKRSDLNHVIAHFGYFGSSKNLQIVDSIDYLKISKEKFGQGFSVLVFL